MHIGDDLTPLVKAEDHFVSVKTCKKRITWEAGEILKTFDPSDRNIRQSRLNFTAEDPIGRHFNWTLYLDQRPVADRADKGWLYPRLMLLHFEGPLFGDELFVSLCVKLYSGTKLIWNGKAEGEQVNKNSNGFEMEPSLYQLHQSCTGDNNLNMVVLEIEISLQGNKYVAARQPKNSNNPMESGERLKRDPSVLLLETGSGSDFVIKVPNAAKNDYYSRKVHKCVLALASPVFEAMVDPEKDTLEFQKGEAVIEDLSETGLDIFLKYLYTGIISPEWMQVPLETFNAAEKYGLQELKEYCKRNLQTSLKELKPFDIEQLAELSRSPDPKKKLEEMVSKAVDDIVHTFKLDALIN